MDIRSALAAGAAGAANALEVIADPARRPGPIRVIDPLDVVGRVSRSMLPTHPTPMVAHAVYYTILAGFVVAEVVEPPMALLLAAGHLMLQSHNRYLQEAGAAVDDSA